ncbi:MAG TPA: hypothetical protein VGM14_00470 [Streptosporangiaceae bacterium]
MNHGDSCAQGCITPDERERGTPPLLRRIRPSSWRHRGFKPAQRFWARPDHAATDAVFAQQHVAKHDREERGPSKDGHSKDGHSQERHDPRELDPGRFGGVA